MLGTAVPDSDEAALQRLVAGGVVEDVDLEFKEGPYGRDNQGKHELVKDVAAMANMRGGVIVLGVHADEGRAARLTPLGLDEAEELRMRQLLASSVAPVPTCEICRVMSEGNPDVGYYLLVVARTAAAPHAVVRDKWLGYPRRSGASIRWLHESEVADAYRSRFAGEQAQLERLTRVHTDGQKGLSEETGWIAVSLVPNVPGGTDWGMAALNRVRSWWDDRRPARITGTGLETVSGHEVLGVGFRRFIASDRLITGGQATQFHFEMHTDGSAFAVISAWAEWHKGQANEVRGFPNQWLTMSLIACLTEVAAFAQNVAGAGGDAAVRVELLAPMSEQPRLLGAYGPGGSYRVIGQQEEVIADHALSLEDLTADVASQLAATRLVLDDVCAAFGEPENPFITTDGELLLHKFNRRDREALQRWRGEAPAQS